MLECKLCNSKFKNLNVLSAHITKKHKDISQQYYYDTFIEPNTTHICPTCGKLTKFLSIGYGYKTHCNQECANKDPKIINIRHETLNKTYGHPFSRPEILAKCNETVLNKYGVKNPWLIPQVKENAHSQEALQKHYETLKKNKTFKVSEQENECYEILKQYFSNIKRNYKTNKYPFKCDFYIPEIDCYIECNFHWTHGNMKYDGRKHACKYKLNEWKEKAKKSQYYLNAINVWTYRDIVKYKCAKKYKLNYIVLWDLQDLNTWIDSNFEIRHDY